LEVKGEPVNWVKAREPRSSWNPYLGPPVGRPRLFNDEGDPNLLQGKLLIGRSHPASVIV
jgi:hypothetical protein